MKINSITYICEILGPLESPEDAAGLWGDYRNCDAPRWLVEATFDYIAENNPVIAFSFVLIHKI